MRRLKEKPLQPNRMFKLKQTRSLGETVRGLFAQPIVWEDRLKGRKWIDYAGQFQQQKWGRWDSNSCWALSAVNSIEDQLELMYADNKFSQEAKDFFHDNGYIDESGDFSISEVYIEILGGKGIGGGTVELAAQLLQSNGILPRTKLTYSEEQANAHYSQAEFVADYFNKAKITPELKTLAIQSKKYLTIAYQFIGKKWTTPSNEVLTGHLQLAPICIGIPVPNPSWGWNNAYVQFDPLSPDLAHEVELHYLEADGIRDVSDQYIPSEKRLSPNYPLYICTQLVVYSLSKPQNATSSPVPTPEQSYLTKFWTAVQSFWNNISNPFPIG